MTYLEKIKAMNADGVTSLIKNVMKYTVSGKSMIDIHIDDVSHEIPNRKEDIKAFLESECEEKETKGDGSDEQG